MNLDTIFKAYDIRGKFPEELDEETARNIAYGFADFLGPRRIVVGRDIRESSPSLSKAFIQGLMARGADVVDIGLATTPMLYWAITAGNFNGGAMVTASHLGGEFNGFKLCREKAIPLSGTQGLPQVRERAEYAASIELSSSGKGSLEKKDVLDSYVKTLASFIHSPCPLKIVVDAGNGMGALDTPHLLEKVPQWHHSDLFMTFDGRFPNHPPNPTIPSAELKLRATVQKTGADFGVGFDGDADRCEIIDERGWTAPNDLITALIAETFLAQEPHARIVYDLRSSRIVPDTIKKLGGVPVRSRVGHAFIKPKMREVNAVFGGELSGHFYYRDIGFIDNGLLTMIQIANILASKKEKLSRLVDPLKKYSSTGEINIRVTDREGLIKTLKKYFPGCTQDVLDGLSVSCEDVWFNIRPSNTEPLVRLNLEAGSAGVREEKKQHVLSLIKQIDLHMEVQAD